MSKTELSMQRGARVNLIPIDGQSEDAGLCVDGVCALPESTLTKPDEIAATESSESNRTTPAQGTNP